MNTKIPSNSGIPNIGTLTNPSKFLFVNKNKVK